VPGISPSDLQNLCMEVRKRRERDSSGGRPFQPAGAVEG
jgi:hypothetical protein